MLKISDAGVWNDDLNRLLDVFVSQMAQRGRRIKRSEYEFKFSSITTRTRPFYERLIDYFVQRADGYFCAFVVDKRVPGINPIAACGSTWDALITYSITLLRTNVGKARDDERAIVVADNYQKPRQHGKYFERELVQALGAKSVNVAMADSGSSQLLQLVDILLGAVMYHHKLPMLPRVDADKKAVADRVARAYGIPTLATNVTITVPNYFSVWQFRPRVAIP